MIDFELDEQEQQIQQLVHALAENMIRPLSAKYDSYEHEHDEKPELAQIAQLLGRGPGSGAPSSNGGSGGGDGSPTSAVARKTSTIVLAVEELCWGDVGIMLAMPGLGLGNAAINAVGTPEQKERLGKLFCSMAITEPGCGSDSSAISTTAELDEETNEWVINGEKIFVTSGRGSDAVVVWATLDRSLGRPAIKSFVVEKTRPGCEVTKLEHKLGIRASDTAAITFTDCRIPYDNILGSPEIQPAEGFAGVMQTFDNTRPVVAAQAIGVARSALEFTQKTLEEAGHTFPDDIPYNQMTAVQRDVLEMQAELEAARLLTHRAARMGDMGIRNSLQASMCKAKAGRAATLITQKCVQLLGPLGYSKQMMVEKWMRDSKITDLFEGTGQIQLLIIARNILGYSRAELA